MRRAVCSSSRNSAASLAQSTGIPEAAASRMCPPTVAGCGAKGWNHDFGGAGFWWERKTVLMLVCTSVESILPGSLGAEAHLGLLDRHIRKNSKKPFLDGFRYEQVRAEDSLSAVWEIKMFRRPAEKPGSDSDCACDCVLQNGVQICTWMGFKRSFAMWFTVSPACHLLYVSTAEFPGALQMKNSFYNTFHSSSTHLISILAKDMNCASSSRRDWAQLSPYSSQSCS